MMEKYLKGKVDSTRHWLEERTLAQDLIHKNAVAQVKP
jgi:hypothetical protein